MVSGTLALKNGYYYAVLSYQDAAGKRHQKWVSTGLPQKGNKRRAEQELIRIRSEFEIPALCRLCAIARKLISSLLCNCDGGARFGVVSVSPVPAESRLKSGFFARKALRDRLF